MPKIDIHRQRLITRLGKSLSGAELEKLLEAAKGECDNPEVEMLRVELNDTNRPDLWSEAGLVRQLRAAIGAKITTYSFFSHPEKEITTWKEEKRPTVKVDPLVKECRPYIAAAIARGPAIDKGFLEEFVQMQEKLSENYGRHRETLAIGAYRLDHIQFPVHYRAVEPKSVQFCPLGLEKHLNLLEILKEHPKGVQYAHLVNEFPRFPLLTDAQSRVLSFPPIINSDDVGKVEVGDRNLFIECTGSSLEVILLALSIMTCNLADEGYQIEPVAIEYPYSTAHGKQMITPFYFQKSISASRKVIEQMLGKTFNEGELSTALACAGLSVEVGSDEVKVEVPPYRNDFLHEVDVVEEVMIGVGLDQFSPQRLNEFAIGRLLPRESLLRQVRSLMVGLGFQEMLFNYLGSERDFIHKIYSESKWSEMRECAVRVDNPLSAGYEYLRFSPLPSLLMAESVSSHAVYPHAVFEVGEVITQDSDSAEGTSTHNVLGFLYADMGTDFNTVSCQVSALLYYLSQDYHTEEKEDDRMISGRCAIIRNKNRVFGVMGEVHPRVLKAWNIMMPCVYAEVFLDCIMSSDYGV